MFNEIYHDVYIKSKITTDELRRFPDFAKKTEEDLCFIADQLYDLAILYQKIMIEDNE